MPTEKLLTSISNPAGMRPSAQRSKVRITQPAKGPMAIAPMNIGMSLPRITPITATAAITPPRSPATWRPAVMAISIGSR